MQIYLHKTGLQGLLHYGFVRSRFGRRARRFAHPRSRALTQVQTPGLERLCRWLKLGTRVEQELLGKLDPLGNAVTGIGDQNSGNAPVAARAAVTGGKKVH